MSFLFISIGASKWDIPNFPRPVHKPDPNFKRQGANQACNRLADLQEFKASHTVKVNPDRPQLQARFVTLEAQKTLLVPTPRLRTGLFNKITPPEGATKEQLRKCASSQGVKDFSEPVGLDAKVTVDLVVVGSVAVSENGFRIGKGEGYADMEYGMMACMGAVSESTVVVTVVHDCQVVDIPEELMGSHDLTVDYILTPTRVIKTNCELPKPKGIIWSKKKLEKIPILKKLRSLEEQAGKDVTLGAVVAAVEPVQASHPKRQPRRRPRLSSQQDAGGEPSQDSRPDKGVESQQKPDTENSPEGEGAIPLRLTWQGAQRRAFLDYIDPQTADQALEALQGLSLNGQDLQAELAKSQRGGRRPGQSNRRPRPSPATKPQSSPPPTTQRNEA
uniref:Methenyltetrahydrofolate synthase domain-containing protein n=1 Tax=Gouania willdenowi TaxID=441366 RepID=A0A8C5G368_GOUWI